MNQQSQRQEPQQEKSPSKVLSWLDQRLIGPLVGALITAIVAGRVVIQITGVQFNIGLMVLVALVMFVIMGISFFLGMGYILLYIFSIFTKQEPPMIYRIVARVSSIVLFPFWWKEWWKQRKNTSPPDESVEQVLARVREKLESKDIQK
jgi:hypothetical protein